MGKWERKSCLSNLGGILTQFAPGKEIVRQGDLQNTLFIIRQGTCTISRTIDISSPLLDKDDLGHPLQTREYPYVLHQVKASANYHVKRREGKGVWREFEVGVLTGGQVMNEFTVLENSTKIASPVTVRAATAVNTLVISAENITEIMDYFYGETMARFRKSLLLYSTYNDATINKIYAERKGWQQQKKKIVKDNVKITNKLRRIKRDVREQGEIIKHH